MSYKNPQDGSPTYVVKFNHEQKEIDNMKKFVVEQFANKDSKVETAIHQQGDNTEKVMRDSNVIWFNDKTISGILMTCMNIANHETGWKYKLTGHETLQMTRYEEGGQYAWHVDGDGTTNEARSFDFEGSRSLTKTAEPHLLGTIRKLSASVIINDDYEGGHFETMHLHDGKVIKSKVQADPGSAIIFPSTVTHRVTPVTKGTRYSIVVWFAGPPFV